MAINAPVLPADTHACAWPAFTKLSAIRIDESFFLRSAISIGSSIATTSLAACTENDLERSVYVFQAYIESARFARQESVRHPDGRAGNEARREQSRTGRNRRPYSQWRCG